MAIIISHFFEYKNYLFCMEHGFIITRFLVLVALLFAILALIFDFYQRKIPNSLNIVILFIWITLWFIYSPHIFIFLVKVGILLLLVYWITFLGVFNAAYWKLFFSVGIFSLAMEIEIDFLTNFFLLLFSYLILRSIVFYLLFFLKKQNRKLFFHHIQTKKLTLNMKSLNRLGVLLCTIVISIYGYPIIQHYLFSYFMSSWDRYLDIVDRNFLSLLFFSVSLFFCSSFFSFIFNKYKRLSPFFSALFLFFVFFIIERVMNISFGTWSLVMTLAMISFWMGLKFFLSGYIGISYEKFMDYTKLMPWMMLDSWFLKNRFNIEIKGNALLEKPEIVFIQESIKKAIKDTPSLPGEVVVLNRFLLTPFIFCSLCLAILRINIIALY